jgi:adenylate kinase
MGAVGLRAVMLGAPGSGKGTQAEVLARALGIPTISTGEMLRQAVAEGSELGARVEGIMAAGKLVDDALMAEVVAERLARPDAAAGFLLDGYPRTPPQAETLDVLLAARGASLDAVLLLDVPEEELVRRLSGRRACRDCGKGYNVVFDPPAVEDVCDGCGGALYQRDDDSEDTVRNRLEV